jgi:hypothetical protein
MNKNTEVDQAAHVDFEGIKIFITSLKGNRLFQASNDALNMQSNKDQTAHVDKVITEYEQIVKTYLGLSQKAIMSKQLNGKPLNNQQRAYYYDQVLTRIMNHTELLTELTQSSFQQRLKYSPLIESIIAGILTRFTDAPVLIPVISSEFKFIHFNYMNNFGVIGIPLTIWTTPAWNLSVLWHEVGGYGVALAKRYGHLEQWARELVKNLKKAKDNDLLWRYYRNSYERSALKSVPVKLEVSKKQCRVDRSRQIRHYFKYLVADSESSLGDVETNIEWQMAWLGEFFEDLFGVQALKDTMLEVLADIFMRRYELPSLGDRQHPPPDLRLQVVLEFLYLLSERNETDPRGIQELLQKLQDRYIALQHLSFGQHRSSKSDLKQTAEIIAKLYYQQIGIFFKDIDEQERKVARVVSGIRSNTSADPYKLAEALEQAQKDCAGVKIDYLKEPQPAQDFWQYVGINIKDEDHLDIEALLKVRFAETDETPGGGPPPPFPPR